ALPVAARCAENQREPKNASRCPKNASQTVLQLRYVSNKRPVGDRTHPNARKAAMEMCAICREKLGLGTRFRNIYGMAVGGFMFAFVRFVARAFMSSSKRCRQTGTPSSLAAISGADCYRPWSRHCASAF